MGGIALQCGYAWPDRCDLSDGVGLPNDVLPPPDSFSAAVATSSEEPLRSASAIDDFGMLNFSMTPRQQLLQLGAQVKKLHQRVVELGSRGIPYERGLDDVDEGLQYIEEKLQDAGAAKDTGDPQAEQKALTYADQEIKAVRGRLNDLDRALDEQDKLAEAEKAAAELQKLPPLYGPAGHAGKDMSNRQLLSSEQQAPLVLTGVALDAAERRFTDQVKNLNHAPSTFRRSAPPVSGTGNALNRELLPSHAQSPDILTGAAALLLGGLLWLYGPKFSFAGALPAAGPQKRDQI